MSWEHADEARAALNAIVNDPQHGVGALSSAQTMSNLLKDLLPDAPREKSILVAAAEAGLADTLRQHVDQGMDPDTAIRLTSSSFSSTTPFTAEACSWVTGEIATALGLSHSQPAGSGAAGGSPAGFGQPQSPGPYPPGQYPTQGRGGDVGNAATQQTRPGQWQQPGHPGAQHGGYGGQPGGPGPNQPGPWQPASPAGYGGQPGGPGAGHAQPGTPGGWPAQPGYGQPGGPGGWQPGGAGYGPVPGGPKRRGRRGVLIGSSIAAVLVVAGVVTAVSLSGGNKPAHHSHSPAPHQSTPVVSSSSPIASPTPTYPHPQGTDALTTIMNPAGGKPVGSDCIIAKKFNMDANTMDARLFCPHTTKTNVVVWGYQFKGFGNYQKELNLINTYVGFNKATPGSTCPPPSGNSEGSVGWHANHNPKYISRPGQTIECLTDGGKPVLIWTMPTQDVFFIGQDNTVGTSINSLLDWWKTLVYGP